MYWRDIGNLVAEKTILDSLRRPMKEFVSREVFCNKKSVRQSEFYQANAQGFKPELMLEVRSDDYEGEEYIDYGGKRYRIIRSYDKNGEITELVCVSMVSGNG